MKIKCSGKQITEVIITTGNAAPILWHHLVSARRGSRKGGDRLDIEGVRKFTLDWQDQPARVVPEMGHLNYWRAIFRTQGLVGADRARYGGIGFGNLSCRSGTGFLITGSQTGALDTLDPIHFCLVTTWDIAGNHLQACGPTAPSSEALSHAACYDGHPEINWVFHIHSPGLWHAAPRLKLPTTRADIAYGTPAMAEAVAQLLHGNLTLPCLVHMGGHEDGLIATGSSAEDTGNIVERYLAVIGGS